MSAPPPEPEYAVAEPAAGRAARASYQAKRAVVAGALATLGAATEIVSKHSAELREELAGVADGWSFALGVLPNGPTMTMRREQGRLRYLGGSDQGGSVRVLFKNVDAAMLVLTGRLAPHTSMAEKRAVVHGPLDEGMIVNRIMAIVTKLLYPTFMLAKLSKRLPARTRGDRLLAARLYATLTPALLAQVRR